MFSPAHHKRPSDSSNVMGSPQRAGRTAGTAGAGAGTSSLEGPPMVSARPILGKLP